MNDWVCQYMYEGRWDTYMILSDEPWDRQTIVPMTRTTLEACIELMRVRVNYEHDAERWRILNTITFEIIPVAVLGL